MPFWKRRKVIYTWDNNYVPTCEADTFIKHQQALTWTCPENIYIELTAVHTGLYAAMGIRSSEIDFHLYSAQHRYFRYRLRNLLTGNTSYYLYLITSGALPKTITPAHVQTDWLPSNVKLIPGDRIAFTVEGDFFPNDMWLGLTLRYNRYDLT